MPSRYRGNQYAQDHPFIDYIMPMPLLVHFNLPPMDHYDGTTNPQEHLNMSNSTMLIFGAIDAIVCCTFPSTLKKSGLLWSSSLEPNSTQDFADLVDKFLTHFSTNSDHKKTSANLINLHQRSDETFKDFMHRFN